MVEYPFLVGNGVCNGVDYATESCENDGQDCVDCAVGIISRVGDGFCDGGSYLECSNDGGDCDECTLYDTDDLGNGVCN